MSDSLATYTTTYAACQRFCVYAHMARAATFKLAQHLHDGEITIIEDGRVERFRGAVNPLNLRATIMVHDARFYKRFLTGGSMITRVTLESAEWNEVPWRFEAGTPAIAEAIGLGAAVEYLEAIGMSNVRAHERALFEAAWRALGQIDGLRRMGPESADAHAGVISFVVDGIHPHDLAEILDRHGIAVRAGHHCAQPVMQRYDLPATTRASFSVYNDLDDLERLTDGIRAAQRIFGLA